MQLFTVGLLQRCEFMISASSHTTDIRDGAIDHPISGTVFSLMLPYVRNGRF